MRAPPCERTIHTAFGVQSRLSPQRPAVRRGHELCTYYELEQRSDAIARSLTRLGVRPGDPVGVMAGRSIAMVSALLGTLKAGACYVPIDPSLPPARKRFIIEDTALRVIVRDERTEVLHCDDAVSVHTTGTLERQQPNDGAAQRLTMDGGSPAYVMYTSGSTGKPKGVVIAHESVLNLTQDPDYVPLLQNDRLLLTGAIGFDQTTFEIWGALLNGLTLYLPDDEQALLDARAFGEMLARHEITTVLMTTALCMRLLAQSAAVFRPLKYLLVGGDALLPETCHLIQSFCPRIRIINGYGPTESTTFATTYTVESEYMLSVPIGKPLRNVTAHVVSESGEVIEDGAPGELWIGGANLAIGYLGRPDLTQERFVYHPTLGRVYRSGDLVRRRADGNLEFLGRKDRQIKAGGYRIELNEVEAAIAAIPGVLGCAVRVWEHNGEKFIAGYYSGPHAPDEETLRRRLRDTLPAYMVPAFLRRLEALPLDGHGKIAHKALPDPFDEAHAVTNAARPPLDDELEQRLLSAWRKALGISDARADHDFYALGGSSIKAVHLMGILAAEGVELSLADIMHYRTVAELTAHLRARRGDGPTRGGEREIIDRLCERHPGATFRFARLATSKREKPLLVLYCNAALQPDDLAAWLSRTAAPEWQPQYIVRDSLQPAQDEPELMEQLQLRPASDADAGELGRRVRLDVDCNDRRFKTAKPLRVYPFSPVQELQYGFRVPPSRAAFRVDSYLDADLFRRAYARFVADQPLLRAAVLESDDGLQWHEHELVPGSAPDPTLIDLSQYWLSDEETSSLLAEAIERLRFSGDGLQYHVIAVRRNAREHALLLVFHHALFDRVSMEVVERELMARYRELAAADGSVARSPAASFEVYVRQVFAGPHGITREQLMDAFRLDDFHEAKAALLASSRVQPVDDSYWFDIAVPAPGHLESGHSVGTALSLYARAIHAVFGVPRTPFLFVHDGRRYGTDEYYDVIGELIDFVPMVVDASASPQAIQRDVHERLALLATHSVNFMRLVLRPPRGWEDVARLVDPGPARSRMDICMFNYMGNQPRSQALQTSADVRVTPNPLPMHSFLNCIAVSDRNGFVFQFRSSYAPRVDELRAALCNTANPSSSR